MKRKNIYNYLTKVSIFAAISSILYYFPKFSLPFFPSFLEVQFSLFPAILSGFILGPVGGAIVLLIKAIIKLPSSHTLYIGELADLVIGLAVVLSSSIYYSHHKTKKGGRNALIIGSIAWVVMGVISNLLINIPLYTKFMFDGNLQIIVNECQKIFPSINISNFYVYYLGLSIVPFNILLSTVVSLITYFVYKRVSHIFKHDFFNKDSSTVLVICDSFKGTLTSLEVGKTVSSTLNNLGYDASYLPISDGGEGFLDSIKHTFSGTKKVTIDSVDCFFRKRKATYLLFDDTGYFELGSTCGISIIKKEELDVFKASTYGLGILIKDAIINHHIKKAIIGIGGSASNDAGSGMLEALGVKYFKHDGTVINNLCNELLHDVDHLDISELNSLISGVSFTVLSDVDNPLLGVNGATYIYSKQKGAKESDYEVLEGNIKNFINVINHTDGLTTSCEDIHGSGAAGGVGFGALTFLKASIKSGIETILEEYHFGDIVNNYDIIITGEGRLDLQSLSGKVISGILKYNPKVVHFVVGSSLLTDEVSNIYPIVPMVATIDEAMTNPKESLKKLIKKVYKKTN